MQFAVSIYERFVLDQPRLTLLAVVVIVGFFAFFAQDFKLDASADSLLLERDTDLRYYRGIRARYGSDDYLVVTYTTKTDLFAPATLAEIKQLRDELVALDSISTVTTMLDVPLISSPPITLQELQKEVPNLASPRTDIELARQELTGSPLYRELIMSLDGRTTALLAVFRKDPVYLDLLGQRDEIHERQLIAELSEDEKRRLRMLDARIGIERARVTEWQQIEIATIREILDRYRGNAEIRLGGLPMIVTDMLDFIRHDVLVFGIGILVFLIGLLFTFFVRARWVVLSILCCLMSVITMVGYLGMTHWPVTVVSANFVALLLIFSLSITVHLIVRYRELHGLNPNREQRWLVQNTIRDKFMPCLFTSVTTMVAFASLLVSGIRPVIDFGWMMTIGIVVVMIMAFTVFPAGLMLVKPGIPQHHRASTGAITGFLAMLVQRWPGRVGVFYVLLAGLSIWGATLLSVENRFIDNFKDTTEIYQGMVTIDRELGGTTPLDVILDADPAFFQAEPAVEAAGEFDDEFEDEFDEEFADEFEDELAEEGGDLGSTSYWYNTYQLEAVQRVHDYLESLPETGKVLSMATTIETLRVLNENKKPSTFWLSILYKRLPEQVKKALFEPYMSADGNQMRLSIRVFESNPNLKRKALLNEISTHLVEEMGFAPEQVHVTGMLVLYNNLLQSLYRSQILTIGFVFLAMMMMFVLLYRSLITALIVLIPNMLAAGSVLGMMGLLSIPLDIMTITIAAIIIGIAVDDSIHYMHRFRQEFEDCGDYNLAMQRSNGSIGRAMYYTSIIIAAGFSILVLSSFIPTIFFGILTASAMLFAMVANLNLLPLLLVWIKPLGKEQSS
jgi:predicted RND superfamily exporter protein